MGFIKMQKNNPGVILEGMNLLNQIVGDYPHAISFASGRPNEKFYDICSWERYVNRFAEYFRQREGITSARALGLLGQYGTTNGIINDLISGMLLEDEGVRVDPGAIVLTCGAQEAMALCLLVLCPNPDDMVMVCDPTYVGITGAALITRTRICSVGMDHSGPSIDQMVEAIRESKRQGLNIRAFYMIPNFDNPTGIVTSLARRAELLDLCVRENIALLEDNPYGQFRYHGQPVPNLKCLDQNNCVIYIGSFAKTICPSLRVGFMALPKNPDWVRRFSQAKSFVTLNTSQYNQAVVGGYLLANNGSLIEVLRPAVDFYRHNCNLIKQSLDRHFADRFDGISWVVPEGGFFVMLKLPFEFSAEDMALCASRFRVIIVPVSCLSLSDKWANYVRLSFSYIIPEDIDIGVERFRSYVDSRLNA